MVDADVKRFWSNVDRSSNCWEWLASGTNGYGRMWVNGKQEMAHRLSWAIHKGPIPNGMCVCHHCDNPCCVNPDHLFLGTHKDNMRDRDGKGRGAVPDNSGSKHPLAKLTDDDVRSIRARATAGEKQKTIAKAFGISVSTTSQIVNRHRWSHL